MSIFITIDSFSIPPPPLTTTRTRTTSRQRSTSYYYYNDVTNIISNRNRNRNNNGSLFLFRRIFGNGHKNNKNKNNKDKKDPQKDNKNNKKKKNEDTTTILVNSNSSSTKTTLSPLEQAQMLRTQAERTRLEAEKMDIMLTLEKIQKLEVELEKVQSSSTRNNSSYSNSSKDTSIIVNEDDIRKQIQTLKKKLNTSTTTSSTNTTSTTTTNTATTATTTNTATNTNNEKLSSIKTTTDVDTVVRSIIEDVKKPSTSTTTSSTTTSPPSTTILSKEEIESRIQKFNNAPNFMKELVVNAAGMEMENLNMTALIIKMEKDERTYYNNIQPSSIVEDKTENDKQQQQQQPMPTFTQEQIDEVMEAVKLVPQFVKNMYGDDIKNNDTAIALLMLEEEWREGRIVEMPEITQQMIDNKLEEVKWVPQFLRGENDTELALELIKMDFKNNPKKFRDEVLGATEESSNKEDNDMSKLEGVDKSSSSTSSKGGGFFSPRLFGDSSSQSQEEKSAKDQMVEQLFPKTTRREGEEPSEKDLKVALVDVFAKDNTWSPTGQPEQVPGGYIIRGITKYESGKDLIEAIDTNLEAANLADKMAVFYVFDPTPVTEEQMEGGERPPVLFITGSKVVRDAQPILRSIISSLALGTVWYTSLVPYLLNDKYMKMADEQLALADASMPANLDFLNDLSFPLFATLIGIQVAHEIAHSIVAKVNGLNISFPTLVPSLASGLTGAITSLQSPPKDKQALFDFAIAGPLAGIFVSIILMYVGMFMSSSLDASSFSDLPALPLVLLRQSSLAGGIIDSVNPGLLSIPDAALGTSALADINIPLHPLTIAGYFGLMINAVNLLPLGRTDGGRISLALFGRSGTQLVNLIAFTGLFFAGLTGSDLLLLFFSYVIFFQGELEIPQRNEVDDMDFSRVLLATVTGVLTLLTLIPM